MSASFDAEVWRMATVLLVLLGTPRLACLPACLPISSRMCTADVLRCARRPSLALGPPLPHRCAYLHVPCAALCFFGTHARLRAPSAPSCPCPWYLHPPVHLHSPPQPFAPGPWPPSFAVLRGKRAPCWEYLATQCAPALPCPASIVPTTRENRSTHTHRFAPRPHILGGPR